MKPATKIFFIAIVFLIIIASGCIGEETISYNGKEYKKTGFEQLCNGEKVQPIDKNFNGTTIWLEITETNKENPKKIYLSTFGECSIYEQKE